MRTYVVRAGDSPGSIAATNAGCPKCSIDLIRSNPHKATRTLPNGYVTFEGLREGEELNLPDKWLSKEFDELPPAYFKSLPHPDGVTPSTLGVAAAAGVLGDYAALDTAAVKVGKLAAMGDQPFSDAVDDTAFSIDVSVREVDEGLGTPARYAAPFAQAARASAEQARQRNTSLVAAINADDRSASAQERDAILRDFSSALVSARLALQTLYGEQPTTPAVWGVDIGRAVIDPTPMTQATIAAVAKAAAAAIGSDANYCAAVAQPGSAVNTAVHAFKTAWNAVNPGSRVPINTGTYEQATADAIARTIGTAPAACGARAPAPTPTSPSPFQAVLPPQKPTGISAAGIFGLGLLGAGVVGGAIYLATNKDVFRRARVVGASYQRWHWVENDAEIVLFVGSKTAALSWYKKNGGTKSGLHLISADASQGVRPVVGKTWDDAAGLTQEEES